MGTGETRDDPYLYRIDYGDVRKAMLDYLLNGTSENQTIDAFSRYHLRWDRFTGASQDEAKTWLTKGFDIKAAKENAHGDVYAKARRRMRWSDDGDLDVGQVLAGADFPYYKWDQRLRKPGLAIVAEYDFSANVDGSLLTDYGAWLLSQIKRFETNGYDLDVSLQILLRDTYHNGPKFVDLRIIVKRENEATDSRFWSPLFSPMGFRGLGFLAIGMAGERNKWRPTAGLGYPYAHDRWACFFNDATRTLRITCPSRGQEAFDPDSMTSMLNDALPEGQ
jgi:hypothetical protein